MKKHILGLFSIYFESLKASSDEKFILFLFGYFRITSVGNEIFFKFLFLFVFK